MTKSHSSPRNPHRPTGSPDQEIVYGWHAGLAALSNPRRTVRKVLATANALNRLRTENVNTLPENAANVREIEKITGPKVVHQGLVVCCDSLPAPDLDEIAGADLIVILDQVTDPHNVGAILRSAAAFGAAALIATHRHAPLDSAIVAKTASGGYEQVPIVRVKNLARALQDVGNFGFERIGLDSEATIELRTLDRAPKTALVLGAEGRGLRRLTKEKCDRLATLVLPGEIESLNVSNAAAIALYEWNRGRL